MRMLVTLVLAQSLNLNQQPILCMEESAYCRADKLRAFELNCSGAGVTCTQVGGRMTMTVPGGSGGGSSYDGGKVGEAYAADASISAQTAGYATLSGTADAAGFASVAAFAHAAGSADASVYAATAGAAATAYAADASITAQYLTLTCVGGEFVTCSGSSCSCSTPPGGGGGLSYAESAAASLAGF